jgi:carbonic anhydrase
VADAKVVLVMGHTRCGAVKGAIDGVQLGNLTGLLDTIKPAIAATSYDGDRSGKNYAFVDAVAATNVKQTIEALRASSPVLADLEKQGKIRIVGSMYNLSNGQVSFMA